MRRLKRNPATRAAGRAPNWFAWAAERSEDTSARLGEQDRRDGNAEARIQAAIVEWIRTVAPGLLIFAVPNGGLRSKAEAAEKWTGVVAGIPDLVVVAPRGQVLFLEVKTASGSLSPEQRAIFGHLTASTAVRSCARSMTFGGRSQRGASRRARRPYERAESSFRRRADRPRDLSAFGLTAAEAALIESQFDPLHHRHTTKLFGLCPRLALTGRNAFDALHAKSVCFLPGDRFSIRRLPRDVDPRPSWP